MAAVFLKLLNLSISASWLVLAVLALRLVSKRSPKWMNVLLWGIVALRLMLPFSIESALSLIPSAETVSPAVVQFDPAPTITSGVSVIDNAVNPALSEHFAAAPTASVNPLYVWTEIAGWVWLIGLGAMLLYALVSYLRLRRRVSVSLCVRENIYLCDAISSPFILGVVKPRIYLPSGLDEVQRQNVLSHERAHLTRRDHWWKPLGFVLLAVYWFNPVLWLAYALLCRDIELACDERVVRDMNRAQRAAYSQALLDCAMPRRRRLVLCPLAFGEVGVRDRVKSVLHYRRPGVWLSAAAVLLCAALAMTFLTEPKPARTGVSPEAASGQTDPDRLQEVSSKVLIVSSTLDPAAQRISYTVQLTEEPEDWIAQKQWYGVASYADVEIFYPEAGSYYRQTDVPHLRFYEWGLADQPTDLESQRPDTDTRYDDYIVDSVTVLSVDGVQRSTFRRVGQSLLLEEDPRYSGGSVSFHAWLQ